MRKRIFTTIPLVVAIVFGLWFAVAGSMAASRERDCARRWTAAFGSLDDLRKRYPEHPTNEVATKLEAATRPLGFGLTPTVARSRPGSLRESQPAAQQKRDQAVMEFVWAQLGKPDPFVDRPPEEVSRFFETNRSELDAVESLLVENSPPSWSAESSSFERKLANCLGEIRLQRTLIARALAAAREGRNDAAERSLEASWKLNESLRFVPDVVPTLIAIAVSDMETGALRKMTVANEEVWSARLRALDYRRILLDSFALEYSGPRSATVKAGGAGARTASWPQRTRAFFEGPLARLGMAEYSSAMCRELARLRDNPRFDHIAASPSTDDSKTSRILISISMPNIENAFLRADRVDVDNELTAKILDARRMRKAHGDRWPQTIPGIEASRFEGGSWHYEVAPDGTMSLTFNRVLVSPSRPDTALPLRFSSS